MYYISILNGYLWIFCFTLQKKGNAQLFSSEDPKLLHRYECNIVANIYEIYSNHFATLCKTFYWLYQSCKCYWFQIRLSTSFYQKNVRRINFRNAVILITIRRWIRCKKIVHRFQYGQLLSVITPSKWRSIWPTSIRRMWHFPTRINGLKAQFFVLV